MSELKALPSLLEQSCIAIECPNTEKQQICYKSARFEVVGGLRQRSEAIRDIRKLS